MFLSYSSGGSRGESISLPFPAQEAARSLGLGALLHAKARSIASSFLSVCSLLFMALTLLLPFYKDPCDYIGLPLQIIQNNLPIYGSLT